MPHRAQQITLQEYVHAVHEQLERVQRLAGLIQELVAQWRLAPLVNVLQALRDVSLIVAVTTIAELGDLSRFDSAKQLMAYLGLVPSEHSSGGTVKRGGIPRPAMAMSGGRSLKQPMLTVTRPEKAESCWLAWKVCPKRFDRLPGKPRSGSVIDSKGSWPEERTETL